jgi:hypothetical protein
MRALRRRAKDIGLVAALAGLTIYAAVAFADTITVDGDTAVTPPNIKYEPTGTPTARACDTRSTAQAPTSVPGSVTVNYGGSAHYDAGANVTVTLTPSVAAVAAGITATGGTGTVNDSTDSGTDWNDNNDEFAVLTSTTVPSTAPDGVYFIDVSVSGAATDNHGDPITLTIPGQYHVNVDCVDDGGGGDVNQPPYVSLDAGDVSGPEGSLLSNNGAFADDDGDPLEISKLSGLGSVVEDLITDGVWTWSHTPDDNYVSQGVSVQASDGTDTATDSFNWTSTNVAPTITALTANPVNALTGQSVTFTGTATDPSSVDTTAGFNWAFNGGSYGAAGANTFTTSFSTCGTGNTVTAKAKDKDGGESAAATSVSVSVFDATILPPLQPDVQNAIKRGQVVPVKIRVGCGSTPTTGLSPSVRLVAGDQSASADLDDPVQSITTSVSNADTTGIMRETDTSGMYIYNMQIPASAVVDSIYTVVVRPFGQGTGQRTALVKVRK